MNPLRRYPLLASIFQPFERRHLKVSSTVGAAMMVVAQARSLCIATVVASCKASVSMAR